MELSKENIQTLTFEQLKALNVYQVHQLETFPEGLIKVKELVAAERARIDAQEREIPVEELTWAVMQKMSGPELRKFRLRPGGTEKVEELIAARNAERAAVRDQVAEEPLTEEEQAAVAAAEAAAAADAVVADIAAQAAAATAAQKAIDEAAAAEAVRAQVVAAVEPPKPTRFVIEFQATDEAGNAIGNKTHLEAATQDELNEKMKNSYIHAVRALDRAKKQKPTFRTEEPIKPVTQEEWDAVATEAASADPAVREAAIQKLAEKKIQAAQHKAAVAEETSRRFSCSYKFVMDHRDDYENCDANGKMIEQYLKDNNLEYTVDNLEIAFGNLESQLAPPVRPAAVEVPAPSTVDNTPAAVAPAAPVAPAAAAAPVAPVAPVAPAAAVVVPSVAPAPAAANPAPAVPARRPGVNAGLIPGQTLSGVKPLAKEPEFTLKDVAKMSAEQMRQRQRIDPKFYDKINALIAAKKK